MEKQIFVFWSAKISLHKLKDFFLFSFLFFWMVLKDLFLNFIAKSIESYNKGLNNFSVTFIYNNIEEKWKYHLASWNRVQEPKGTVAWNLDL